MCELHLARGHEIKQGSAFDNMFRVDVDKGNSSMCEIHEGFCVARMPASSSVFLQVPRESKT